jgi:hypothetical protein
MDKFGEIERVKPSKPNVNKTKQKPNTQFFDRVDELRAYKEKHNHLNVRRKDDESLYDFCSTLRQARKGKGNYRLDDGQIAALDAIGFDYWNMGLPIGQVSKLYKVANVDKQNYPTELSVQPPSTEAGVSSRGRIRKMSRAMAESVSQQDFDRKQIDAKQEADSLRSTKRKRVTAMMAEAYSSYPRKYLTTPSRCSTTVALCHAAGDDNERVSSSIARLPFPLAHRNDEEYLSPLQCYIRKTCLEFFAADASNATNKGWQTSVSEGRVGVRCVFCKHLPRDEQAAQAGEYAISPPAVLVSWISSHIFCHNPTPSS